jgi:hypothetical protein
MRWYGGAGLSCTFDRNVEDITVLSFAGRDVGHQLIINVKVLIP